MIVVLSAAYMNGRLLFPASSSSFSWRTASEVCWRLIGIAAADLHAREASVLSSSGVWVSSDVNRMENWDASLPPPAAGEEPFPELAQPASTSAAAVAPTAIAQGMTRWGRTFCLFTSNPFFDGGVASALRSWR